MKHFRLLSFFLWLILPLAMWAGPRTFKQAQAIAERQAEQMGITISQQAKARSFANNSTVSSTSSENAAYYVFSYGENQGYAIVSGDDQMPELVAYSDKGTMDENMMPDGCREFLKAYQEVAELVAKGDAEALKLMAQKRGLLASAEYQQPKVEPLLGNIAWDQYKPYNNMCPGPSEEKYLTGCVATAMAQVMKYWRYPESLVADIPATSYTSLIPKGEKYDWDLMLPTYKYPAGDYTQSQADAVAKLMLHCGAATKMSYTYYGSSAFLNPQVFATYFGYDPDLLNLLWRGSYGLSEWCKFIDDELVANRPVIYGAQSSDVGHEFVCDGSDGKGLYHINWGWGGEFNGYFDITILDRTKRVVGAGSGSDGYNREAVMVIGLQPDNGVKDEPLVKAHAIQASKQSISLSLSERKSSSEKFSLVMSCQLSNQQIENFNGIVSVGYKDKNGQYVPLSSKKSMSFPGLDLRGSYSYEYCRWNVEYAFPVGTTTLYQIYSTDDGQTWLPCSYAEGCYPQEVMATETSLSIVEENADFKATIQNEGDLIATQDCNFSYTMHNANSHDYFGKVKILTSNTPNYNTARVQIEDYVDIAASGSTTHYFTLSPDDSGDLYIWILNEKLGSKIIDGQKFTIADYVAPKLKLLSKSINIRDNVYEKAYYYGYSVKMPVIDGNEAIVKYVIQNDGGTYKGNLPLTVDIFTANDLTSITINQQCCLMGNGGVTELEYRFKNKDLNERNSFNCKLENSDQCGEIDYSSIAGFWLLLADYSGGFNIKNDELVGYFDDAATDILSIPSVAEGMIVSAGKGILTISATKWQSVTIYSISGQCVRRLNVQPGTTTISLPSGIYVVGKQKVLIK